MKRQETINKAVAWALGIANDSAHGYDQSSRWGPNYDCSSFVISAWQKAGVPVKSSGASFTGNMYFSFIKCGFRDVTNEVNVYTAAGMKKGDVLLNAANHTEMYIGDGKNVKASINERGTVTGGQSGDQTGREIYVGPYYNYPWDYVLRYEGGENEDKTVNPPTEKPDEPTAEKFSLEFYILRRGDGMGDRTWLRPHVRSMQIQLNGNDCSVGTYGTDGEFGPGTEAALLAFQRRNNLSPDGVYGPNTAAKLQGLS